MEHEQIVDLLRETDAGRLETLWREADRLRRENVGDEVHLRGLVEFSNYCRRACGYCGLRARNSRLRRYRMSADEILGSARLADRLGYGTVVLQSGEDGGLDANWLGDVIRRIKGETPLAVTLSVGERDEEELAAWRESGADRYLLRFETSNRRLFERIHPPRDGQTADRLATLRVLAGLGYEVGSGVLIGIPGQTYDDLARDVELFAELGLDMIGVGPYIAHPETPLGRMAKDNFTWDEQVPADELTTCKVMALARLVCPAANIPSTTALATLNADSGWELGLARGANVVMPNVTPSEHRELYEIYPGKVCVKETTKGFDDCLRERIESMGRRVGKGRGDSPGYQRKARAGKQPVAPKRQ